MPDTTIEHPVAPIQIGRPVSNINGICGYARALGVTIEDPADLHVTLVWSRKPVDWNKSVFQTRDYPVIVPPNKISLDTLQDLVILKLSSPALTSRFEKLCAAGATTDWNGFIAHITLGKIPDHGLAGSPAFNEVLMLGPEYRKPAKIEKSPLKGDT
jgi:hypothetical protein